MKPGDVRRGVEGVGLYLLLDPHVIGKVFWRVFILEANPDIKEDDSLFDNIREGWLKDYTEHFT